MTTALSAETVINSSEKDGDGTMTPALCGVTALNVFAETGRGNETPARSGVTVIDGSEELAAGPLTETEAAMPKGPAGVTTTGGPEWKARPLET